VRNWAEHDANADERARVMRENKFFFENEGKKIKAK